MDFCSKVAIKLLLEGFEKEGKKKNILTSPLSYNAIMNMIAAGSSNDTLVQILQFLEHNNIKEVNSESAKFVEITTGQTRKGSKRKRISGSKRKTKVTRVDGNGDGPTISFLNGVWVNNKYPLKNSFQEMLENIYKAKVRNIDCGKPKLAVQEVNEWASASTNGLIKEVLQKDHITPDTTLKGSWKKGFVKSRTEDDEFYLLDGETIQVPFMSGCEDYSHNFFEDFQVARIPYKSGVNVEEKFAMHIILPYEKDGLEGLLKSVNSNPEFFSQHCSLWGSTVDIFEIPKFKFSFSTENGPGIMKNMGLTLPFDRENAEFNEMVEVEHLYVSNIIQKAFVEVNEEGTVASAVTLARNATGGFAPGRFMERTEFIADHPFMFIIREENSGIIFFAGTLLNPLEEV